MVMSNVSWVNHLMHFDVNRLAFRPKVNVWGAVRDYTEDRAIANCTIPFKPLSHRASRTLVAPGMHMHFVIEIAFPNQLLLFSVMFLLPRALFKRIMQLHRGFQDLLGLLIKFGILRS